LPPRARRARRARQLRSRSFMFGRRTRTEGYAENGRGDEGRAERGRHPLAQRTMSDASGAGWRIYEMAAGHVPGARAARCLIMESESRGVCRRFWSYPANWQELSADELLALSPREP
jgi:hypothetical protein